MFQVVVTDNHRDNHCDNQGDNQGDNHLTTMFYTAFQYVADMVTTKVTTIVTTKWFVYRMWWHLWRMASGKKKATIGRFLIQCFRSLKGQAEYPDEPPKFRCVF